MNSPVDFTSVRQKMYIPKNPLTLMIKESCFLCLCQMKTPPDRSGIIFEVGGQLEARDCHKNWSGPRTHTHTHTHQFDTTKDAILQKH